MVQLSEKGRKANYFDSEFLMVGKKNGPSIYWSWTEIESSFQKNERKTNQEDANNI